MVQAEPGYRGNVEPAGQWRDALRGGSPLPRQPSVARPRDGIVNVVAAPE